MDLLHFYLKWYGQLFMKLLKQFLQHERFQQTVVFVKTANLCHLQKSVWFDCHALIGLISDLYCRIAIYLESKHTHTHNHQHGATTAWCNERL